MKGRKEINSEAKVNKTLMLKVNTNCEYSNEIAVNKMNYSTNSSVVRPKHQEKKIPTTLFQVNKRRFGK